LALTKDTQIEPKKEEITYQIPQYKPQHILSPEFKGTSNYEIGVGDLLREKAQALEQLRQDPEATSAKIKQAEEDYKKLETLYENYNIGMNVFRTAKGGRDKIRE
jgi:colicin import membrane protein